MSMEQFWGSFYAIWDLFQPVSCVLDMETRINKIILTLGIQKYNFYFL